ncbi:DUF3987 domain-containing protein [Pseudomonas parakoreensis]
MNFSNGVSSWLPVPGGAFPRSMALPIIGGAVDEAERNIMAPRALIYSAALTAMATAAQGSIDVCKPNGQIGPVSIMVLTVANSGERKSTAENVFMGGVRRFQDEMDVIYQSELSDWRAKQSIWDARRKAILKETLLLDQHEGVIRINNSWNIKPVHRSNLGASSCCTKMLRRKLCFLGCTRTFQ